MTENVGTEVLEPDVKRFWQHMLKRHPQEGRDGRATAEGTRWHRLDDYGLNISLTMGSHKVRVFIRGDEDAKAAMIQKKLEPAQRQLEDRLNVSMRSEEYGRFFIDELTIDLRDERNWDAAVDWLWARGQTYEAALDEHLKRRT